MILLHRLSAHHFKQLQDIDLKLPESGTLLIEGHNEAGKSSLFEAVFFALFGRPLLGERDYSIADLKRYGTDMMDVALEFSIAGRQFAIARSCGKVHRAKLTAPSEDGNETISGLNEIRKRLSDELRLSSDALLNTCFVEQKRLERLEAMDRDARREAINELLNLKTLTDLEARFRITRDQRDQIDLQKKRVSIARLDAALPQLETAVAQAERVLNTARRAEALQQSQELEKEIEKAHRKQREIKAKREAIASDLEQSTRLAAQLRSVEGELTLRLEGWQNAVAQHEESRRQLEALRQRADTLPLQEKQLHEQQQWAEVLDGLQHRQEIAESVSTFAARRRELQSRQCESEKKLKSVEYNLQLLRRRAPVFCLPLVLAIVALLSGFLGGGTVMLLGFAAALVLSIGGLWLAAMQTRAIAQARQSHAEAQQATSHIEAAAHALELHRPPALQDKTDEAIEALLKEYSGNAQQLEEMTQRLANSRLPMELNALRTYLALRQNELERERETIAQFDSLQGHFESSLLAVNDRRGEFMQCWQAIAAEQDTPETPSLAAEKLRDLEDELTRVAPNDTAAMRSQDENLQAEYSSLDRQIAKWQHERDQNVQIIHAITPQECPTEVRKSVGDAERVLRSSKEALVEHRGERRAAAQLLGLDDEMLNLSVEVQKLSQLEEDVAVHRRAGEIVGKTRADIVSRVMPLTISNVQRVLPMLTEGRYRDVRWDEDANALSVYDFLAGDFVRKRVFSGGARDQISLALRLAFALATLPGEHNIRPGFLFLDEPLSSFDRARTQALVELLTRGLIRQSFQQIFLVSHSQSFDPALFDYRLCMDAGRVVESTLPL